MRVAGIVCSGHALRQISLLWLGWLLLAVGAVGIFLPVLPGLPFLAAGALMLSRERLPFQRAIEKYEARYPFLQRCAALLKKLAAEGESRLHVRSENAALVSPAAKTPPFPYAPSELKQKLNGNEEGGPGVKILIFDASLQDLDRHAAPFEGRGFEVYKCTSVEAALRCIEREEFHLALIDQVSAGFEGLRVVRHLVRYNRHTPFAVLASEHDSSCYLQALSLGAVDYLRKPVSEAELNWIIDRYVATRVDQNDRHGSNQLR